MEIVGVSIGGGKIEVTEINGFQLKLTGQHPAIVVLNNDRFGCIANVAGVLAKHEINIGHMEVSRKEKGKTALMVLETDENVSEEILQEIAGFQIFYMWQESLNNRWIRHEFALYFVMIFIN